MEEQVAANETELELPTPASSPGDQHVFRHQPLTGPKDIRLIQLLPGNSDQPLRCKIVHVSLDQNPWYEAVSYVWGQRVPSSESPCLTVEHGLDQLRVTENCYRVLRLLRGYIRRRTLWVDAICIDQSSTSVKERNHQVNLMKHIYTQAASVLIYPRGPDDHQHITSLADKVEAGWQTDEVIFLTLVDVLRMAWFRRTWVLQEAVLARKPLLVLESGTVDFEKFLEASCGAVLRESIDDVVWPAVSSVRRTIRKGHNYSLLELLDLTRGLGATDPRDRIFALLGIAADGSYDGYVVDYSRSLGETYVAFALAFIAKHKNLAVLRLCDGSPLLGHCDDSDFWETSHALPTWVPDWRRHVYKTILRNTEGMAWEFGTGGNRSLQDQSGQTTQDLKLRGTGEDHWADKPNWTSLQRDTNDGPGMGTLAYYQILVTGLLHIHPLPV